MRSHPEDQITKDPASLRLAIKTGATLIIGARVETSDVGLRFDILERQVDRDDDRRPIYVPVQFSYRNKLAREDSLLAAFHGIILGEAIGTPVPFVKVVHGSGFAVSKIKLIGPTGLTRLVKEARQLLARLRKQIESTSPPLMILNANCPSCEFRDRCRSEAANRGDLSLLRGISEKEILALRERGINTVTQFACTFRPKSIGQKRSKPLKRHLHSLQALAVRDKKVYVVRAPEIPVKPTRVFLDVEGMPDRDFYYLVGVVVEKDGQCSAQSFWAEDKTEEHAIWFKLLDLLRVLGDLTIFHYGSYEKVYIKTMLRKYASLNSPFPGTSDSLLFNVLGAIRTNVYFPVYSNGLKDIASFLGVNWTGNVTSGIECIAARMRWEESKESAIKEEIVEYNRQDCLALEKVANFLLTLGSSETTANPLVHEASEIQVKSPGKFGKIDFAVPEMSFINKCARFNYQRDKVLLRTDPSVRASARRRHAKTKTIRRANVEIQCGPPPHCLFCGHSELALYSNQSVSKQVFDLKISRYGVKRWVVQYVTKRFRCRLQAVFYSTPTQRTRKPDTTWQVGRSISTSPFGYLFLMCL